MYGWYEEEARQRQHDLLHEAAQHRLARMALSKQRRSRLSGRALVWLGHRLIESGKRLQAEV